MDLMERVNRANIPVDTQSQSNGNSSVEDTLYIDRTIFLDRDMLEVMRDLRYLARDESGLPETTSYDIIEDPETGKKRLGDVSSQGLFLITDLVDRGVERDQSREHSDKREVSLRLRVQYSGRNDVAREIEKYLDRLCDAGILGADKEELVIGYIGAGESAQPVNRETVDIFNYMEEKRMGAEVMGSNRYEKGGRQGTDRNMIHMRKRKVFGSKQNEKYPFANKTRQD